MKNLFKTPMLLLVTIGLLITIASCNNDDDGIDVNQLSEADRTFAIQATQGNLAEIELGSMMAQRTERDDVRMFAQMMFEDHQEAQQRLQNAVERYSNADLPNEPDQASQNLMQQLMTLSGYSLDSAYMVNMVRDHEETIARYQAHRGVSTEQSLIDYIDATLPGVEAHYQQAQNIVNALGDSGN